jgi:hypothetical protein
MDTLPPQLLVTVRVPEVGGYWNAIWPVTEYVFVAGAHAPGTAVRDVMLQRILQFVEPVVPPAVVTEIFVG